MKKNKIHKIILLSELTLASISIANKLTFMSATSRNMLSNDDDLYFKWRFGSVFYAKEGKGNPILLIHELNSTGSDFEWKRLKKELAKNHTVYTIDLLGCGRSEKPNFTYTNFLYVQHITDFVKNIIGQRCDVVSSGNASALVLLSCVYHSELFNHIIMINPEEISDSCKLPAACNKLLKNLIELPVIGTMLYNVLHSQLYISMDLRTNKFYNTSKIKSINIQAMHEAAHLGNYSAKFLFSSEKENYTHIPVSAALKKINHNIIILGGTAEPKIEQTIAEYKELNPAIESDLIPNAMHFPHIEEPAKTAEILKTYIC